MRLIDADELWETIKANSYPLVDFCNSHDLGMFSIGIKQVLDEQKTIEAEPVIHAHWEPFEKEAYWFQDIEKIWETGKPTKQIQYRCSHCLAEFGTIVVEQNYMYCPKCNAKIDEVVDNEK